MCVCLCGCCFATAPPAYAPYNPSAAYYPTAPTTGIPATATPYPQPPSTTSGSGPQPVTYRPVNSASGPPPPGTQVVVVHHGPGVNHCLHCCIRYVMFLLLCTFMRVLFLFFAEYNQ